MQKRKIVAMSALGFALLAIALTLIVQTGKSTDAQRIVFYGNALRTAGISESVLVGDTMFTVTDGALDHGASNTEKLDALRLTYALTLARRSPLMAIPGADLHGLERNTYELQDTASRLAAIQKDSGDAKAVRTTLYPISFLNALIKTERARLSFIEVSSLENEIAYESAQRDAVTAYKNDIDAFEKSFKRIVPRSAATYQVLEGPVTWESSVESLDRLRQGIENIEKTLKKRHGCVWSDVAACDSSDIAPPSVRTADSIVSGSIPYYVTEILIAYSMGVDRLASAPLIELSKSVCLNTLGLRPLFSLRERVLGPTHGTYGAGPEFRGDVVFVRADEFENVPYYKYFIDNNVLYVPFPLFESYKCPELQTDIAGVMLTSQIQKAALGERYSQYATTTDDFGVLQSHEALLSTSASPVQERDALGYLSSAVHILNNYRRVPRSAQSTLFDLALASSYRTSGLEQFVRRIVVDEDVDLRLRESGVPVELGAAYLFYVRSGSFSLFQGTNASVVGAQGPPVSAGSTSKEAPFLLYSKLRKKVSSKELMEDIQAFIRMHTDISAPKK